MRPVEFYAGLQAVYPGIDTSPRLAKVARTANKYASGARRILDIGCGDGTFAAELKCLLGASAAFGVEISQAAVDAANTRQVAAHVVDIDQSTLPFDDGYFELIYCGQVIEHLYDRDHLLDEIKRLLAPGGVAILDTPNLASLVNRFALLLGYQPFLTDVSLRYHVGKLRPMDSGGGGHIRVFTKRALEDLLMRHRFSVLEISGCAASEPAYGSYPLLWRFFDGIICRAASLSMILIATFRKGG